MFSRTLYKAREQFLTDGQVAETLQGAVRPEILRSWQRSKRSGAHVDAPTLPFTLDVTEEETPLTIASDPVISRLSDQLSGMCAGVLLSDRHARIVRRWAPDLDFLRRLDKTASVEGFSGSEEFVGTNGIGTATEERGPQIVVGPEHFADILTRFTCVGVPIHHPITRRFEGVITLSARAEAASPLLLPFFTGIAREIEHQLLRYATPRERLLLDTYLIAASHGRPVAVIGPRVLITSPKAALLLQSVDPTETWPRLADALSGAPASFREVRLETRLDSRDGPVRVSCEAIRESGRLVGAVVDVMVDRSEDGDEHRANRRATPAAREEAWPPPDTLLGQSTLWTGLLTLARTKLRSGEPVLLRGEAGTGKTILAKAMHSGAGHAEDACVVLDCASHDTRKLLDTLTSVLITCKGSVILQHIDALGDPAARSLSAAIEGHLSEATVPRIMATMAPAVYDTASRAQQRLHDLLSVVRLDLPPLRARTDDLAILVGYLAKRYVTTPPAFSKQAILALKRAPWPGNVRQLETAIRAVVDEAGGREVTLEMLPPEIAIHSRRRQLTPMEQVELEAILSALARSRGNKVLAARHLGISRSTLYRKMISYQLDPEQSFF